MSSALVLLMTVGLAFFYGGLVRPKNALNTMMMSVVALGVIGVQWMLVGYSIAFGPGNSWFGGLSWLGLNHVGRIRRGADLRARAGRMTRDRGKPKMTSRVF